MSRKWKQGHETPERRFVSRKPSEIGKLFAEFAVKLRLVRQIPFDQASSAEIASTASPDFPTVDL